MQIRNRDETSFSGDNIYGPGQTRSRTVAVNVSANYVLKVQNDGSAPGSFRIKGPGGGSGWTVKYFDTNQDVVSGVEKTASVSGSGWIIGPLAAGASKKFLLVVRPRAIASGTRSVAVTTTSTADGTKQDFVTVVTTKKRS